MTRTGVHTQLQSYQKLTHLNCLKKTIFRFDNGKITYTVSCCNRDRG